MLDERVELSQALRLIARLFAEELWRAMPQDVRTGRASREDVAARAFDPQGLLTVKEASTMLGVPARRVYELASRRELKAVRIGRSVRFRRRDIDAYIEERIEQPVLLSRQRDRPQ
jgi:excisionase family DNA binding protein